MSAFANYYCHLWKLEQAESTTALTNLNTSVFKPQFPPKLTTTSFWVYGTATSQAANGSRHFNNGNCGDTVYWRSLVSVDITQTNVQFDGAAPLEDRFYELIDSGSKIVAITQAEYDADYTGTVGAVFYARLRQSSACQDISTGAPDLCFADNIQITKHIPTSSTNEGDANASYQQTFVSFQLGQCAGVDYGIELAWQQSIDTPSFALGSDYISDRVGSFQGAISAIRVYITQGQYALSVDHSGGTTEPVYVTKNGNPLYANNYLSGDVAVAELGIFHVVARRIDNQPDNCGNLPFGVELQPEALEVFGYADHDKPIEHEGVLYLPYYGGSASDYEYNAGGDSSNSEVEFALSIDAISEIDLISGRYLNARLTTIYYDWSNKLALFSDTPQFFGQVTILESRHGAFKYRVELKSALSQLDQKNFDIITKLCRYEFGDQDCGIDLQGRGLIDKIPVDGIIDSKNLLIQSDKTDGYYGRIEITKNGRRYTFRVANYDQASQVITTWDSVLSSGLEVGDDIVAIARCDKSIQDCAAFHGHLNNHGGFPFVPTEQMIRRINDPEDG